MKNRGTSSARLEFAWDPFRSEHCITWVHSASLVARLVLHLVVLPWLGELVVSLLIGAVIIALFLKRHHAAYCSPRICCGRSRRARTRLNSGLGSLGMFLFERHVNEKLQYMTCSAMVNRRLHWQAGFITSPLTRGGETVAHTHVVLVSR